MGHLRDVNMRYFQHLRHAWRTGLVMILAGVACIIHGLLPFMLRRVASRAVSRLYYRLIRGNK